MKVFSLFYDISIITNVLNYFYSATAFLCEAVTPLHSSQLDQCYKVLYYCLFALATFAFNSFFCLLVTF